MAITTSQYLLTGYLVQYEECTIRLAVSLPEGFDMAVVSDILEQEKAKHDLKTAEDVSRVAAAFDGLRCVLADTCVAAHSRAVASAATAEEHGKLLLKLQTAIAAASSLMDAQHEPAIQSARCGHRSPGTSSLHLFLCLPCHVIYFYILHDSRWIHNL